MEWSPKEEPDIFDPQFSVNVEQSDVVRYRPGARALRIFGWLRQWGISLEKILRPTTKRAVKGIEDRVKPKIRNRIYHQ